MSYHDDFVNRHIDLLGDRRNQRDDVPSDDDDQEWEMQQRFLALRAEGKSVAEAEAIVDAEFGNEQGGETDDRADA
jgi:hypothetical protein